jgi:hypothetical protein
MVKDERLQGRNDGGEIKHSSTREVRRKEDLIGKEHKCWRCDYISIITEKGIDHQSNKNGWHWETLTLDGLWEWELFRREMMKIDRRLLYGE